MVLRYNNTGNHEGLEVIVAVSVDVFLPLDGKFAGVDVVLAVLKDVLVELNSFIEEVTFNSISNLVVCTK